MGVIGFLLGWLLADILTGIFHWWEDRHGDESWPIIGPWIIAPNRLHHTDPMAFTRHGFWDRNRASIIAALIFGAGWLWLLGPSSVLVGVVLGAALSNEVHFYAHRPALAPAAVRLLQRTGFLQAPKNHALHHRPPHSVNFCVLTDWLNPLIRRLSHEGS